MVAYIREYSPLDGGLVWCESTYRGSFAVAPANPQAGWIYSNTSDGNDYVYWGGAWVVISAAAPDYLLDETGANLLDETSANLQAG